MTRLLVHRTLLAVLLVVASSSAALLLARLAPGDVMTGLGPFAPRSEVEAARARLDLDRPPLAQWVRWMSRAVRLDFGDSLLYGRPVRPLVVRAALNTAALALVALVAATVVGLGLGIVTGSLRGLIPALIRGASLGCLSLPPLVTSLLLVFAAARTGWLPAGGMSSVEAAGSGWGRLLDVLWHLPVPAVALAVPVAAMLERLQAQALGETLQEPFVRAAAARGVANDGIVLRHAWPASLRAICAVYGLTVGTLLSGSFIVEYVTAWPGMGRLMYEALRARDIYLVAGCAAMGAFVLAVGMLVGDLLLAAADPRVRESGEA